jgi:hypothetical protein
MRTQVIEGITFQDTSSHGYFHLSPERLAQVPAALLTPSTFYDGGHVFEEDCEWARFAVAFPEELPDHQEAAELILRNSHPDIWEAWTGKQLKPGESSERDRAVALAEHAEDLVVITAWGSWHEDVPVGLVGVCAVPGREVDGLRSRSPEAKYFLVSKARYVARPDSGYVIDLG